MKIELANRIRELPPYLFARIDALKNEERKKGKDLIDLGIGDPDLPTPPHIVAALTEAARDPSTTATRRTSAWRLPQGRGDVHADALRPDVRRRRKRSSA